MVYFMGLFMFFQTFWSYEILFADINKFAKMNIFAFVTLDLVTSGNMDTFMFLPERSPRAFRFLQFPDIQHVLEGVIDLLDGLLQEPAPVLFP